MCAYKSTLRLPLVFSPEVFEIEAKQLLFSTVAVLSMEWSQVDTWATQTAKIARYRDGPWERDV